jgi:hypothetical protein
MSSIRNNPVPALLALLIIVFTWLGANAVAGQKAFWFDEILTLRVSEASPGKDLWQAMTAGFEFNPPMAYLAVRASESIYGRGEVSSRLPFMLAGIVSLLFLFLIQLRKGDPWAGTWAILFLLSTEALSYFYEARGYVFTICATLIAWFCVECIDRSARWANLRALGIFFAIAMALLSHMWAILIPACFGCAILIECWQERRLDLKPLIAIALACPIALHYPALVAATKAVQFNNEIYNIPFFQATELILYRLPILCLFLVLIILVLSPFLRSAAKPSLEAKINFETLLCLGLIATPFLIYAATRVTSTAFMRRYTLLFALGVAILLAKQFSPIFSRAHRAIQVVLVTVALAVVFVRFATDISRVDKTSDHKFEDVEFSPLVNGKEPIFFGNGLDYLSAEFYAGPQLSKRFHFVADRGRAIQFTGTDGVDSAMILGESRLHLHNRLASWQDLTKIQSSFWVVDSESPLNWLRPALFAAGYDVKRFRFGKQTVLYVTRPS